MKKYIIWGSSGHAKVIHDLIKLDGGQVVALFDNNEQASSAIDGVPLFYGVEGFKTWVNSRKDYIGEDYYGIAAIGGARGKDRIHIHGQFQKNGINVESLIHQKAYCSKSAYVGKGCQVLAMAVISVDVYLGDACIINNMANIDHECYISKGVHVAPGATLCGCVHVGENSFIGSGSVVLPRIKIGSNCIVGAGSVVTKDIDDGVIVCGNPARVMKLSNNCS